MSERLLLDTVYVLALLNRNDPLHQKAKQFVERIRAASVVFVTEAVLLEIGNGLRVINLRQHAAKFINGCYEGADENLCVVPINTDLIRRSLKMFEDRPDKEWSLTDCISFVVMADNKTEDAVTADNHFIQAQFRALMLEN